MATRPIDPFDVPETAIRAFERLTHLNVVVHDLNKSLLPFLSPDRLQHRQPLCAAVKAQHDAACVRFEVNQLRPEIHAWADGRYHVCHAGLVEWIVPAFNAGRLEWIFFAGQRIAGPKLREAFHDPAPPPRPNPLSPGAQLPGAVDDEEAAGILEALRQLVARVRLWKIESRGMISTPAVPHSPSPGDPLSTRRLLVRRYIHDNHKRPLTMADVARVLHLSEGRAAHVVREACGSTFWQLLAEARVRTACSLLRNTAMPVLEVALCSGFGDVSRFHRVFRARTGLTPLAFRKHADAPPPPSVEEAGPEAMKS